MRKNIIKSLILVPFLCLLLSGCNMQKVKITKSQTKTIEYDTYDNGLVSFVYPKGWTVEVAPTDYIHYGFRVYNPENHNYSFLFCLKNEGFLKTQEARNTYTNYYPDSIFAQLPAIDPQTTEAYFKVWNDLADMKDQEFNFFIHLNDFNVIENLGTGMLGGDILRANYKDDNDNLVQGIFTASVKSIGTYYINTNIFNLFSPKVDVSPLNVYNIIYYSAPDEDFINWEPVLNKSLSSITFSQTFVDGFNKEETTLVSTIQANQKVYNQISDMIMDSWEKRNTSYDIISQKQSDATLGYERVYDTNTNEIYKAPNGFMDSYSGNRYQLITEDMYTLPIDGYIE